MSQLPRPQPLGIFPLPAGYLLIGPEPTAGADASNEPSHDEIRSALLAGRRPEVFPSTLRYYELALDGDLDGALAAIDITPDAGGVDDPIARANQLVLDPDPTRYQRLMADLADDGPRPDPALRHVVETVAFIVGLEQLPPAAAGSGDTAIDGELAALALAGHATLALERSDRAAAVEHLEAAAQAAHSVSAPMAGQLLGQLANAQLDDGGAQRASVTFQAAIDAMEGTDLFASRAELHVAAGAMFQEMSEAAPRLMQQAINHYLQATALVTSETAPETYAIANANLGLAYLTMPMHEASDQLRVGVAVQSMREALEYFTPQNHPDRWSSTQLNLANALVYMPSKHQADNIAEAVGLYEGVLQHRDRQVDPLGRARVLSNQGNALAHLGVFGDAKAKLHEARAIFEEFAEEEAVRTVRSVLDEIAKHESLARQDAT
jgi:tetratricopeptide (TPR) repeat protein